LKLYDAALPAIGTVEETAPFTRNEIDPLGELVLVSVAVAVNEVPNVVLAGTPLSARLVPDKLPVPTVTE
jgi:hypothetical protein